MKDCCYLRIEDVSVGNNNAFDHPDYRYTCELFNKRIFYGICKGCKHYKVKMVEKIYSVETELHDYADDMFIGTIGECEDYIRNQNLLDSKDIGEVRVALLTVQNDGETHCEELYKCEKAYRVDENQNVVSCIVYTKANLSD